MEFDTIVVMITTASKEEAEKIAETVVIERLAACAQTGVPIRSFYWWDGKVNKDPEQLLILKSRKELLPEIIRRVKQLHSYDVPEIIAVPVIDGSDEYLKWLKRETGGHD